MPQRKPRGRRMFEMMSKAATKKEQGKRYALQMAMKRCFGKKYNNMKATKEFIIAAFETFKDLEEQEKEIVVAFFKVYYKGMKHYPA